MRKVEMVEVIGQSDPADENYLERFTSIVKAFLSRAGGGECILYMWARGNSDRVMLQTLDFWVAEALCILQGYIESIMFKSDEELGKLLDHPNNGARVAVMGIGQDDRSDRTPIRHTPARNLEEKIDIALLASVVGIKNASELIGTTPGVVSRIASGENSQGVKDSKLSAAVENKKAIIKDKALDKAQIFLDMIDGSGDSHDQFRRAHTAEKLVTIYERLEPKVPEKQYNTQVVFYTPKLREEVEYQIIEVEAQKG